jgi:hypothetical protein
MINTNLILQEVIMTKKDKFASDEATSTEQTEAPQVEVQLTDEQIALVNALDGDGNLSELRDAEGTSESLKTLIIVYLALLTALGAEAGATLAALGNLRAYQPAKVKAVKAPKAPKVPVFNEVKALKDALAAEEPFAELLTLVEDERISDGLKIAIQTYTTLANLPLDQAIIDGAKDTLARFGKGRTGTVTRTIFNIEANGVVYSTLTGAIAAQGIEKVFSTEDAKHDDAGIAWMFIRPRLLKEDGASVEYNGVVYTRTDAPANDKPEVVAEAA